MPELDYTTVCENVSKIAIKAGTIVMRVYTDEQDIGLAYKSDDSPLTIADQRSNSFICTELLKLYPDIPIISEESTQVAYEIRKEYINYWLVDPLDGTKEFVNRNGDFTVNIALIHQRQTMLGIIYVPVTKELFYGFGNTAFYVNNGIERSLDTAAFSNNDSGVRIACSRSHMGDETRSYISGFDEANIMSRGSSLKFTMLATGDADIYPRFSPTAEWDTAAGQAILEAAGGKVIDQETAKPMLYNKLSLINPSFIAYGKQV